LQVVGIEYAHTLTETTALHMRAKQTCTDALGKKRLAHNSLTSTLTSLTFEMTILTYDREKKIVLHNYITIKGDNGI